MIRFMAFFSLTMVLISTCTFVISTIDKLQENEKEKNINWSNTYITGLFS